MKVKSGNNKKFMQLIQSLAHEESYVLLATLTHVASRNLTAALVLTSQVHMVLRIHIIVPCNPVNAA